jgi:hypothetical protein
MAQETAVGADVETGTKLEPWQAGTVAGIAGGIVMGVMMTLQTPDVIAVAIPALYGLEGGLVGWIIHVSNGAILGVVFAALLVATGRRSLDVSTGTGAGLVYGIGVWLALAVVVMPIWLSAVGFAGAPPLPNVSVTSLVAHVAYGLVLGVTYALLSR